MWRRTYLLLLLIRVYFALCPSYIHPDEHFQGPEVFAGWIYSYQSNLTWEFTSDHPIRSVFPLWAPYVVPMSLLKWFYAEAGTETPPPELVYYALRGAFFLLSFVLEDWAIYELVPTLRHRLETVVLVASSYVTWTYQTHTFSNSLETLLVLWGLVLIQRIVESERHSSFFASGVLSFVAVTGVFNRITFPAFLLVPGLQLLPHFWRRPVSFFSFVGFGIVFASIAVLVDTTFYNPSASLAEVFRAPIITPLNNLLYNSNTSNLALHGIHPRYQHVLANLPQLLGPAYVLIVLALFSRSNLTSWLRNIGFVSAVSATAMLSIFPHQEPRFLIPCVPLFLSCIRIRRSRIVLISWVVFNAAFGFLMGVYHQGGVVPTQLAMPSVVAARATSLQTQLPADTAVTATVFWWKTYSPPLWLLGDNQYPLPLDIQTRDLMGISGAEMIQELDKAVPACTAEGSVTPPTQLVFLVAPHSNTFLDLYTASSPSDLDSGGTPAAPFELDAVWSYRNHINLDDLDFGSDGVIATITRVVGRRGLDVWAVQRSGCD